MQRPARGLAASRSIVALLAAAFLAAGCPALLDDDFEIVAPGAGIGEGGSGAVDGGGSGGVGGSAGAAASGGTDGSSGSAGAQGDGSAGEGGGCQCAAGETCCDDVCVDLKVDPSNCRSCGRGCPGTTCSSSECTNDCAFGFLNCDQNVVTGCEVNAATDPDNCGSCGIQCAFDSTCMLGRCTCSEGTENCNGDAADGCEIVLDADPANCGECGKSCGANQVCTAGACVCAPGHGDCNGSADDGCEKSLGDPTSCGSCAKDCGPNGACNAGACGCANGFLDCDGAAGCEAPETNPTTCGSCTTACSGATPVCNGTGCVAGCGPGQTLCGGVSCVNLQTNPSHCGICARMVGAHQQCVNGVPTCSPGFGDCNGSAADGCETDTRSSEAHCGGCNSSCKAGAVCTGSACQCAASTPNDCGSACRECCNATQCGDGNSCTTDSCSAGGVCQSSASCAGGGKCCAGQGCFECCGDADCTGGKVCSSNQCVTPACSPPLVLCGPTCVNPANNAQHCNGCGNDCGLGRSCVSSACTPAWVATGAAPGSFVARSRAASTWTGAHVFIWGGIAAGNSGLNTGALYNPATDSWTTTAVDGNTPSARVLASAVWTGNVVVVWGGGSAMGSTDYNTGGRYDPSSNSWQAMSTSSAPSPRRAPRAIWTGSRVLVWGGYESPSKPASDAYLYDPVNDSWAQASNNGQPNPPLLGSAFGWSGTDVFVYGGRPNGMGDTDQAWAHSAPNNAWRSLPPGPPDRYDAFGGWDGTYFIAWGGRSASPGSPLLPDGERYNPASNSWSSMSTTGAPSARYASYPEHGWTARVQGGDLLLLGGFGSQPSDVKKDGAVYHSTTNAFTAIPAWPSGQSHQYGAGVWTGSEFVLWGGIHGGQPTATGERVRP
jgi:N-acetylneuraminic acid mutarotase